MFKIAKFEYSRTALDKVAKAGQCPTSRYVVVPLDLGYQQEPTVAEGLAAIRDWIARVHPNADLTPLDFIPVT